MSSPLVSICIPTHNGGDFIVECIHSALAQSYENCEIIISDDNSGDDTLSKIKQTLSSSKFYFRVINHTPSGIGDNWNNCVHHASGEYIKFLFQDDLLEINCISKMVELAETNAKIGMVYSMRNIISENTDKFQDWIERFETLHDKWKDLDINNGFISGKKYLADLHLMNEPLNKIGEPSCTLIRRSCFDKVGHFNNNLKQILDFEMWFRIMKHYDIGFVNEKLCSFRLHKEQVSQKNIGQQIDDYSFLDNYYYSKLFKYLHWKNKWQLLKKNHPFFNLFSKFKGK